MAHFKKPTSPRDVVAKLTSNDPNLLSVDLSNNAVVQMKSDEYMLSIAEALRGNTICKEIKLSNCGIMDPGAEELGKALAVNSALEELNLEGNTISSEGAGHIAKGLAQNKTLLRLNLLNQSKGAFGDACLTDFTEMFDTNVTILRITWRLNSRKSFALNKLITRNNEILRRRTQGREFQDLLPEHMRDNADGLPPLAASGSKQRASSETDPPSTTDKDAASDDAGTKAEGEARTKTGGEVGSAPASGTTDGFADNLFVRGGLRHVVRESLRFLYKE